MKTFAAGTLLALLVASPLAAAVAAPPRSQFIDFGNQVFDGAVRAPAALYTSAEQKVKFERLLSLKKSFVPTLLETGKERAFK